MKSLTFLILVVCGVLLFLHDRQQTNDLESARAALDKAQSDNSELTGKINVMQGQINNLQARLAQAEQAAAAAGEPMGRPAPQPPRSGGGSSLGGPGGLGGTSLDRGSYKN